MNRKRILSLVGAAVIIIGAVGYYLYNEKTPTASEKEMEVSIDAVALYAAFVKDEAAAGLLYNDKVVQVTGTVRDIAVDPNGPVNVMLETGDALGAVVCEFSKDNAPAWKKDMKVTIKGFCAGFNLDVLLQRCAAVE